MPMFKIRTFNDILTTLYTPFTLGTRFFLTCDVSGLSEWNEVNDYRWFRNCTASTNGQCQIQDGDLYYRVVSNTLMVDVSSWNQGGRYSCFVRFSNSSDSSTLTFITAGRLALAQ